MCGFSKNLHSLISTHAPARGATIGRTVSLTDLFISTHAPARGATMFRIPLGQSSSISTHAPARGATGYYNMDCMIGIFQPTLPRGERLRSRTCAVQADDFNPRSREGSDETLLPTFLALSISTHAPARGATIIKF